jgi:RimJ/RimL family protein N-acetyltransferase
VLSRSRVTLEPWQPHHDNDLFESAQHDDIWRWLPVRRPQAVGDVTHIRVTHPGLPWVVLVDGRAAGSTSYLNVDLQVGGIEIGWTWYRRDLWSSSVNPACKLLLMGHAFDDLEAQRITLRTDALNTRSQAAIRKLGCQHDGTLRHDRLRADGTVRDSAMFSMLVDEWPAAAASLASRASA